MNIEERKKITEALIGTFESAGILSLDLREKGLKEKIKEDNTPVTNGDLEVNKLITNRITKITPNLPIISEELSLNKNKENLKNFWLIDPIDGTYDYINNKDEFTLNAALILNNKPAIGIINAPDKKRLFYSYGAGNSFEINEQKTSKLLAGKHSNREDLLAVSYSKNLKPEILNIHKKYKIQKFVKMKSSLKFCVIAAGEYDLYVAEPRACEWDIAAGHAILEHAGGSINDTEGKEIFYGKKDFKNPGIILKGFKLIYDRSN